uniref:Uncharacterized protein n=1 Tax=viral metagenome TaxID=1070528 RepID=A0A6C0AT96_9ZZZZ
MMDIGDFFGKISKFFSIPGNVGNALGEIFEGVVREFTGVPQGIWYGALDASVFIQYVWEFVITNFTCGMKMLQNIQACAFYYFMDILGHILYLPFRMIFWIVEKLIPGTGGKLENLIWDNLDKVDRYTISNFGFHIIHFSKPVRDLCYNCKRLKPMVFVGKAEEIVEDIVDPITPLLVGGLVEMVQGLGNLVNAFKI